MQPSQVDRFVRDAVVNPEDDAVIVPGHAEQDGPLGWGRQAVGPGSTVLRPQQEDVGSGE